MRAVMQEQGGGKQQVLIVGRKTYGGETYTVEVDIPDEYGVVSVTRSGEDARNSSYRKLHAVNMDMKTRVLSIKGENLRIVSMYHSFDILLAGV